MKISIYKAIEHSKPIKCTIQKTGKLGFSDGAIAFMEIKDEKNRNIFIGHNEEDKKDENLYAYLSDVEHPDAFKINKAGEYYYVNTKILFDTMGLDYTNKYITFDVSPMDLDGKTIYKLTKRVKDRFIDEFEKGGVD